MNFKSSWLGFISWTHHTYYLTYTYTCCDVIYDEYNNLLQTVFIDWLYSSYNHVVMSNWIYETKYNGDWTITYNDNNDILNDIIV